MDRLSGYVAGLVPTRVADAAKPLAALVALEAVAALGATYHGMAWVGARCVRESGDRHAEKFKASLALVRSAVSKVETTASLASLINNEVNTLFTPLERYVVVAGAVTALALSIEIRRRVFSKIDETERLFATWKYHQGRCLKEGGTWKSDEENLPNYKCEGVLWNWDEEGRSRLPEGGLSRTKAYKNVHFTEKDFTGPGLSLEPEQAHLPATCAELVKKEPDSEWAGRVLSITDWSASAIKQRWKELVLAVHPDKSNEGGGALFQCVNIARDVALNDSTGGALPSDDLVMRSEARNWDEINEQRIDCLSSSFLSSNNKLFHFVMQQEGYSWRKMMGCYGASDSTKQEQLLKNFDVARTPPKTEAQPALPQA